MLVISFPRQCQSIPRIITNTGAKFLEAQEYQKKPPVRNFPPALLGLEMAAPILWAPGIFGLILLETPHAHKIPRLGGGVLEGGGCANFMFMGVGIFPRMPFLTAVLSPFSV